MGGVAVAGTRGGTRAAWSRTALAANAGALEDDIRRPYPECPSLLLAQPAPGPRVIALKGCEATTVTGRLLLDKASRPKRGVAPEPTPGASGEDGYISAHEFPARQVTK